MKKILAVIFCSILVAADIEAKPLSMIARDEGFTHTIHSTHLKNLQGILTARCLVAGSKAQGAIPGDPFGNHDAVFLSLAQLDENRLDKLLIFADNRLPLLVFSLPETVDRYAFHANIGYMCGRYFLSDALDGSHHKTVNSKEPEQFRLFIRRPQFHKRNELVFQEAVALDGLVRLYVAPGMKAQLMQIVAEAKLPPPKAGEWQEVIQEVTPLKSQLPVLQVLSRFL